MKVHFITKMSLCRNHYYLDDFVNSNAKNEYSKIDNITQVVDQYLCNTCGACKFTCPKNAIEFKETIGGYLFPKIDNKICTNCGLCVKVCPGIHFGKTLIEKMPTDPFVGNIISCYVGKSLNEEVYTNAQSGGIATALLLNELQANRIQAAIVTVMKEGNPPRAAVQVAYSCEEIIASQKSKYSPVPVLEALREIESRNLDFGIVGLPCQIHGLLNILDIKPQLKDKIKLKIGLICDRTMTRAATDYLVSKAKLDSEITILHFRDKSANGYPGSVNILRGKGGKGDNVSMPPSTRMDIKDLFTPARCWLCFDKLNIYSDITIGDPWGISIADHHLGESVVIIRTEKGEGLIKNAVENNAIKLREIQCQDVIKGQKIQEKRGDWRGFCDTWEDMGFYLPDYYNIVIKKSSSGTKKNYKKLLEQSLMLDKYESRKEIVNQAKLAVLKKNFKKRISWPHRKAKRMLQKFLSLFSNKPSS